jgi:hypothetical protein
MRRRAPATPGGASITAIEIENFPRPRFRGTVYTFIKYTSGNLSFYLPSGCRSALTLDIYTLVSRAELATRNASLVRSSLVSCDYFVGITILHGAFPFLAPPSPRNSGLIRLSDFTIPRRLTRRELIRIPLSLPSNDSITVPLPLNPTCRLLRQKNS